MTTSTAKPPPSGTGRERPAARWWERPWIAPLALLCGIFVAFSVPPYARLDPATAPIPIWEEPVWYYPMLLSHIFGGTVLMALVILQVWPWIRRNHPAVHRWSGRVYVMFGIPFVGVPALLIAPHSHGGTSVAIINVLWATAWLAFTSIGYVMARRRRYATHREWMLRSFALILSIPLARVSVPLLTIAMLPRLESGYGGDLEALILDIAPGAAFLNTVLPLLFVEWWLKYRRPGGRGARRQRTG
ncbi:DUF2306 domain-containing protein [Nocardiopsis sp. CT-R113]|uniref:DUF2306 domain-containing protein n=1 Tax=Nocardiopsis codii TaxID=3065942 RepID=A0ABU7KHU4_9ACTN|nr:DUF2306 domain-containing protein [Nocardiopsis sp. CT-R113]MEE2041773.1 DUF2306 domain-containing protein [Nocardiopsis sp. CT-R113]